MLCSECGERPATFHMTRIVNNQKTEVHLCDSCAREHGGEWAFTMEPKFSVHDLLASMLPVPGRVGPRTAPEPVCDGCGLTYREFARSGLLGCPRCYDTFREPLASILRRVHGSLDHRGKAPPQRWETRQVEREMESLRTRLQQAVQEERYEDAARLRDQLRSLERRLGGAEG